MLGKLFGILTVISLLFGIATGNAEALGNAALDGASDAVALTLSLAGSMCLWCGIMRVLQEAGAISLLARLMRPFLRWFFPDSSEPGTGAEEIASNIAANLLGMGNAATPFALAALDHMQKRNPHPDTPTNDMVALAVMNTASINLLPTTILTLRRGAGAQEPFSVLIPIWITSSICCISALLLTRAVGSLKHQAQGGKQ